MKLRSRGKDGLWRYLARLFPTGSPRKRLPNLAVLIDGDGISPKHAGKVLEHLPTLGRVCVLRAYGNYSGGAAAAWTGLIRKHGIVARHMSCQNIAGQVLAISEINIRDADIAALFRTQACTWT